MFVLPGSCPALGFLLVYFPPVVCSSSRIWVELTQCSNSVSPFFFLLCRVACLYWVAPAICCISFPANLSRFAVLFSHRDSVLCCCQFVCCVVFNPLSLYKLSRLSLQITQRQTQLLFSCLRLSGSCFAVWVSWVCLLLCVHVALCFPSPFFLAVCKLLFFVSLIRLLWYASSSYFFSACICCAASLFLFFFLTVMPALTTSFC